MLIWLLKMSAKTRRFFELVERIRGGVIGWEIETVYWNNFWFSIWNSSRFYSSGNELSTWATPTNWWPNISQKATINYTGKIVIRFSKTIYDYSYITWYIRIKKNGITLEDLLFQTWTEYKWYDVEEWDYFEIETYWSYRSWHSEYYISVVWTIWLCYSIKSTPDIWQLATIS